MALKIPQFGIICGGGDKIELASTHKRATIIYFVTNLRLSVKKFFF